MGYKFSKKKMVMAILVLLTLITMDTTFVSCVQGRSRLQKVEKKVRFKVSENDKSYNTKGKGSKKKEPNLHKTSRQKKNELNKYKKYRSSKKNGKTLKFKQKNKKFIKKRRGRSQAKSRGRVDREINTKSKRNIKVRSKSEGPPPTVARLSSVNTQIKEISSGFSKAKDELDMHFDDWKLKLENEKQGLESSGVAFFKNKKKSKMESRNSGTLFFNQVGKHLCDYLLG